MFIETTVDEQLPWAELAAELLGTVSRPGQAGYDAVTPWNLAVWPRPGAIVAVRSADDVAQTMRWAARYGLRVAVRCTGHAPTVLGPDAILVDTSALTGLVIDPVAAVAVVQAGVLWEDVIAAAAKHGLMPVCGSSTKISAVGFLTGGGVGPMARSLGVGSDRVRRFDVVTGDGTLRRVTATEHPDLFWGLRGGKSALGIVVAVEFDLVRISSFFGGGAYFAAEDLSAVLHAWRSWAQALPEKATTSACILRLPDRPDVPRQLAGQTTLAIRFTWLGEHERGRQLAGELLSTATPILGGFEVAPVAAIAAVHADPVAPIGVREEGFLLDEFTADAVEEIVVATDHRSETSLLALEIRQLGGRVSEPPAHPDAFDGRAASWSLLLVGLTEPDPDALDEELVAIAHRLQRWSHGLAMPNFRPADDPVAIKRLYRPETLDHLATLSQRYDPDQVLDVGRIVRAAARSAHRQPRW
ncbi:MAG: FAD-binding oxidoreductase [Candidatus Dormibacteria bacterium]